MEPIKPCVIESPFAGAVSWNREYLQRCIRYCLRNGYTPYASHQMLTQALDDTIPESRRLGMAAGRHMTAHLLEHGASWFVFADLGVSAGMRETILALQADGFRPTLVMLSLDPVEPFQVSDLYSTAQTDIRQEMRQTVNKTLNTAYEILGGFVEGLSDVALQRAYEAAPSEFGATAPTDAEIEAERLRAERATPLPPSASISFGYKAQAARAVRTPEPEPAETARVWTVIDEFAPLPDEPSQLTDAIPYILQKPVDEPAPEPPATAEVLAPVDEAPSKFDQIVNEPEPAKPASRFDGRSHQAGNADTLKEKYAPRVLAALPALKLPFSGYGTEIIRACELPFSPTVLGHALTKLMDDGAIDASKVVRHGRPTLYEIRGIDGAKPAPAPEPTAPVEVLAPAVFIVSPVVEPAVPVGGLLTNGRIIDVLTEHGKIQGTDEKVCTILLGRPPVDRAERMTIRSLLRLHTDQWVFSFHYEPRFSAEVWKLA